MVAAALYILIKFLGPKYSSSSSTFSLVDITWIKNDSILKWYVMNHRGKKGYIDI